VALVFNRWKSRFTYDPLIVIDAGPAAVQDSGWPLAVVGRG